MIESSVPKSRLHEIAKRKLAALGIPSSLTPDGRELVGELKTDGALLNPLSGRPIEGIRFAAEGHDHLRFLSPSLLASHRPLQFFDIDRPGQLYARLRATLEQRGAAARACAAKFRNLGLSTELIPERGVAAAKIELAGSGTAVIEGDDRGVRAAWLVSRSSSRGPVSLGDRPINLEELGHKVDLELYLAQMAEAALKEPDSKPTPASPAPTTPGPAATPTPPGALTFGLLAEKLGVDAKLEAGFTLTRDLVVDGKRARFAARHESGKTFRGKLVTTTSTLFDERFDLDRFPGLDVLVARLLTESAPAPAPPAPTAVPEAPAAPALAPGQLLPVAGELWVMTVVPEGEEGDRIRYQIADAEGRPFGPPRTIGKVEFTATFEAAGNGWRLLTRVLEVRGGNVSFVQLDPNRQPVGTPRASPLAGFLATFAPEAAAY